LPRNLPLIKGGEDCILWILLNLLVNALKFIESGEVSLSAVVQDGWVKLVVADGGILIPKEKQENIFGAFKRGDAFMERTYGGTDLGLCVAK
jgi:signal transduction histidine kinase